MIETKITKDNLDEFLKNLRYQDRQEMLKVMTPNFIKEFYDICLNENSASYLLQTTDKQPLALGGAVDVITGFYKTARIWLLCSQYLECNKIQVFKYVKDKLLRFKEEYDILFNFIYKSNFDSLKWLKTQGAIVVDLENIDFKLFYFVNEKRKGEFNFDIRYFACK